MANTAIKPSGRAIGIKGAGAFEFPSDIIPEDDDLYEAWMKQWSTAIYRYGTMVLDEKDIENYRHAQGILDESEFDHVTKLYCNPNSRKVLPVRIPKVNALPRIINDIIGQADEQNLSWNVAVVNEDAIVDKLEKLSQKQAEDLTRLARQQAGVTELLGRPVVEGDDNTPVDPAELEQRSMSTFHQENEINISKGLKYLMAKKTSNYRYKLIHQGLYNYAITGKVAFDTMIGMSDPEIEPIDSRTLCYDLESNSPFIQKGRFGGYYFGITPQEVIDKCPNLTEEEITKVQEMTRMFRQGELRGGSSYWFKHKRYNNLYFNGMKQYWKGLRKKLVKLSPNPYDEENPHVHFVSEEEMEAWNKKKRLLKENGIEDTSGVTFERRYFNVVFECTRLTEDICYQMREMPNQLVNEEEPSEQELPLFGVVDDIPSIIELTKALDKLRIEAFTTVSRLTNQAVGKILVVDEATEEDDTDNMYNMMAYRVYRINSAKEGEIQSGRPPMQPKEIDLGLSSAVNDIMRWIGFIDQNILQITGMNEQYQGNVKSDQGLGVTQLANQSAQRALQPYFATFYTVVEQTLQRVVDLMRPAWAGKTVTKYWMGDKMAEWFSLDPSTDWHADKYGLFLQNTIVDEKRHQFMVQMASQLLPIAKDPEMALAVIKMFNSDSAAEAEQIFEKGIDAMKKLQAEEMKMRQAEMEQRNQAMVQASQIKDKTEADKNQTVITKTGMEQEGETNRLQMELDFQMDEGTVKYKNEINQKIVDNLLEKRAELANNKKKK